MAKTEAKATKATKADAAPKAKSKKVEAAEPRGRKKGQLRLDIEAALKSGVKSSKKTGVVLSELATEFNTTSLTVLRIAEAMDGISIRKVENKNVAYAG